MRPPADLDGLVEAIKAGAGYRSLADDLVRSIAAAELAKRRSAKEALKAARAKLHQLVGAYDDLPRDALARLAEAGPDELPALARELMAGHASTRERLDDLAEYWSLVLADLGPIDSVLDLACGLNPLAVGAMPLPVEARYLACDVHLGLLAADEAYLQRVGRPHEVFAWDLLSGPPPRAADVVLLLKTIPCLEQADKTAGRRLLAALDARLVVVSFPLRSLGGRQVGMADHYAGHFHELLKGLDWQCEQLEAPAELVFRLRRG